jgi:hypothetical protein
MQNEELLLLKQVKHLVTIGLQRVRDNPSVSHFIQRKIKSEYPHEGRASKNFEQEYRDGSKSLEARIVRKLSVRTNGIQNGTSQIQRGTISNCYQELLRLAEVIRHKTLSQTRGSSLQGLLRFMALLHAAVTRGNFHNV